jgi:hypothetical protein
LTGGAGGGGATSADFSGGNITGAGDMPTINGGTASIKDGSPGLTLWSPFRACGGAGGAALNSAAGGVGGGGGIGCGGGGGGAGTTGGVGGRGGDGLVVIVSW